MNPRTFTVVTSTNDPLSAERLVKILVGAGVDAFSRSGGAASASLLGAAEQSYFDVLVASEGLDQAQLLVQAELETIEREGPANAAAAEEEALSDQNPTL